MQKAVSARGGLRSFHFRFSGGETLLSVAYPDGAVHSISYPSTATEFLRTSDHEWTLGMLSAIDAAENSAGPIYRNLCRKLRGDELRKRAEQTGRRAESLFRLGHEMNREANRLLGV